MDWLRLWHDMPNDPKWRTVARISGQPISLIVSMFVHLLVDASRNVTRGHADVTNEDLASALDVAEDQIQAIRVAMQGRVLEGNRLLGWEKRQPKKEDAGNPETGAKSAAERKKEQRERERLAKQSPECHDESRNVTTSHDREEEIREEKRRETKDKTKRVTALSCSDLMADGLTEETANEWLAFRRQKRAPLTASAWEGIKREAAKAGWVMQDVVTKCMARGWQGFEAEWVASGATNGRQHGIDRHGNFGNQDYRAGVGADGSF